MITSQVAADMSPGTFSRVARTSDSCCPKKQLLKRSDLQTIYFCYSFLTMLWRLWVMMTPKQLFIPNNKLSIVCLVCNCFVPTDILKNLKNLSHSLLVSNNNMKALTKQKTIIQSELKHVWIPNSKRVVGFCTQRRVITLINLLHLSGAGLQKDHKDKGEKFLKKLWYCISGKL